MSDTQFTIAHNGQQFGPHTKDEIASMLQTGMIDATAHVWCEGWPTWLPIANLVPARIALTRISPSEQFPQAQTPTIASTRKPQTQLLSVLVIVGIAAGVILLCSTLVYFASRATSMPFGWTDASKSHETDLGPMETSQVGRRPFDESTIEEISVSGVPTFKSILEQLPADSRPDSQWDEFSLPHAHKYLDANVVGKTVSVTAIMGPIRVKRIPGANKDDTIGWKISFHHLNGIPRHIDSAYTVILPSVVDNLARRGQRDESLISGFEIEVSEATAKEARDWDTSSSITFVGTVWIVEAYNWSLGSSINGFMGHPSKPPGVFRVIFDSVKIADVRNISK